MTPQQLSHLPLDILLEVVSFIEDVCDAISLSCVSKNLRTLRSHHSFWHVLLSTLSLSSVPLACPPFYDSTRDLEALTIRTLQRQKRLLFPNSHPVRARKYLESRLPIESISPISGCGLFLTVDLGDGMARCWDLARGIVLNEVYMGRNILAKSTFAVDRGRFLVTMLVAESLQEFVATSIVVLGLNYDVDIDSFGHYSPYHFPVRHQINHAHLSILHRSSLDAAYPAMYPSCAINSEIAAVVKMATSVHIIALNVFTGAKSVIETDLTEIDVDCVDLSFGGGEDLYLCATNTGASWLYRCPKDYLPYGVSSSNSDDVPATRHHHLELSSTILPMVIDPSLFSYERCGFFSSHPMNGNYGSSTNASWSSFATTAYYATGSGKDQYTECCFWHLDSTIGSNEMPIQPAHKLRLPGLQFFDVSCAGSESGAWGVFVCDIDVDVDSLDAIGHDFEIDVGVDHAPVARASRTATSRSQTPTSDSDNTKTEIFMVHYDPFTRTTTVHQPKLPASDSGLNLSVLWINDIKSLDFDERLGILYFMMDCLEGSVLCTLEFL